MIEKFKDIISKEKKEDWITKKPRHVAITTEGKIIYAKKNKLQIREVYKDCFIIIKNIIKTQVKFNIPILSFYVLSTDTKDIEQFSELIDIYIDFLNELTDSELIHTNRIKISVIGKWYNLPGRIVEVIKKMIDNTKDYDNFFLNFCINYSGQEEIVDACKLIAKQVKNEKLDPDLINKSLIKENIYSSYFLPPDLIIINGPKNRTKGVFLWDSSDSIISYTEKLFPDFDKKDFVNVVQRFKETLP
jgi:undecaprenyl diphosphate synthase